MANVWIPAPMHDLTGGQQMVSVPATRVSEIVEALEQRYPGMRARLCQGEGLRPGLAVVVGTEVSRLGLLQPVEPDSEVHFVQAIGGGEKP